LDEKRVYQVLDSTHAKQNLGEIVELLAEPKQATARGKWEYFLWNGQFDALEHSIKESVSKRKRKQAMKKPVLSAVEAKANGLPCGSGHVESAIRRVINASTRPALESTRNLLAQGNGGVLFVPALAVAIGALGNFYLC
jgi:hypothetical protein